MADEIAINIYLNGEGKGETTTEQAIGTGGNIPGMSQASTTAGGDTKENKYDNSLGKLKKYVASQTIDVFINNVKSEISSNIGLITGKNELQQRVNFGISAIQKGVNTYKNVQGGAILLTSAGLSSGTANVVAIALEAINFGINLAFKEANQQIQRNIENRQIKETRNRQGAWVNRSRSGV